MKKLPIAPLAPPARRNLPLADQVREIDKTARPILAVWEITLACDLACGHCGSRSGRVAWQFARDWGGKHGQPYIADVLADVPGNDKA